MNTPKRSLIFNLNPFQVRLLFPILIAISVIFILIAVMYYVSYHTDMIVYENKAATTILYQSNLGKLELLLPMMIIVLSFLVIILIYWSYYVSNKIVGPCERVMREMDQIIEGRRGYIPITSRDGDEMFTQLLMRINVFISRASANESKK
ncbi:MAG: hypothetical protein HQK77_17170 [Desulfobacterales bacterium]|nr:hypothetical protein [Desulfobacterales bacterium]